MSTRAAVEDLLRECAPRVLATLVRRHGHFDACEDAVQEALLAAARQWPADGVPDRPRSWLLTVAGRALVDGAPAPTDGPFAEIKESLAGYWIIEATEQRALDLTAQVVGYSGFPMEVRRIMDEPPQM